MAGGRWDRARRQMSDPHPMLFRIATRVPRLRGIAGSMFIVASAWAGNPRRNPLLRQRSLRERPLERSRPSSGPMCPSPAVQRRGVCNEGR